MDERYLCFYAAARDWWENRLPTNQQGGCLPFATMPSSLGPRSTTRDVGVVDTSTQDPLEGWRAGKLSTTQCIRLAVGLLDPSLISGTSVHRTILATYTPWFRKLCHIARYDRTDHANVTYSGAIPHMAFGLGLSTVVRCRPGSDDTRSC